MSDVPVGPTSTWAAAIPARDQRAAADTTATAIDVATATTCAGISPLSAVSPLAHSSTAAAQARRPVGTPRSHDPQDDSGDQCHESEDDTEAGGEDAEHPAHDPGARERRAMVTPAESQATR